MAPPPPPPPPPPHGPPANYETVKYFANEPFEQERYGKSIEQYQKFSVDTQASPPPSLPPCLPVTPVRLVCVLCACLFICRQPISVAGS